MGTAGDGQKSGFEGSFWNWTRSDEKNALVAQDRAAEAAAKAQFKTELADGDSDGLETLMAQPGTNVARDPQGTLRPVRDEAARRGAKRNRDDARKLKRHAVAMSDRLDHIEAKLAERFAAMDERDGLLGGDLDKLLAFGKTAVRVLNASEAPSNGAALAVAAGLDGMQSSGWGVRNKLLELASAGLTILAYYDPRRGIASLWTSPNGQSLFGFGGSSRAGTGGSSSSDGEPTFI